VLGWLQATLVLDLYVLFCLYVCFVVLFFSPPVGGRGERGSLSLFFFPHPGGRGKEVFICFALPPLYPPQVSHVVWWAGFGVSASVRGFVTFVTRVFRLCSGVCDMCHTVLGVMRCGGFHSVAPLLVGQRCLIGDGLFPI
jgi:hypothetical protein